MFKGDFTKRCWSCSVRVEASSVIVRLNVQICEPSPPVMLCTCMINRWTGGGQSFLHLPPAVWNPITVWSHRKITVNLSVCPQSELSPPLLIELPLRCLVLCAQVHAGMWRRNGFSLINQVSQMETKLYSVSVKVFSFYILDFIGTSKFVKPFRMTCSVYIRPKTWSDSDTVKWDKWNSLKQIKQNYTYTSI